MPDRSRFQEYRDRLRGGPARALQPCGTLAAARRHQRHGEEPCAPCKAALAEHAREQYRKRNAPQPPPRSDSGRGLD